MENQMKIQHRASPVFTDRSITVTQIASLPDKKNSKKALRKEGTLRIIFVDSVSQSSVADVVMTPIAAEQLVNGIRQSIEKLKADLKDPTIPQQAKQEDVEHTYIG